MPSCDIDKWKVSILLFLFKEDGRDDVRAVECLSTLWTLWLHRNEVLFKNTLCSIPRVLFLVEESSNKWQEASKLRLLELVESGLNASKGKPKPFVWTIGSLTQSTFVSLVVDAWKKVRKRRAKEWGAAIT